MRGRLLALALAFPLLGGCVALKRDVRRLETEVASLRAAQEAQQQALIQEIRRQNALLLDSVTIKDIRLRGDVLNRMVSLERQLVQIQELTGQSQQGLSTLRQELRQREEAARAAAAAVSTTPAEPPAAAAANPDELYQTAQAALQRGSLSTARAGFEEFVRAFPQHARAPDAQLAIGDTYERSRDVQRAVDAYERVLEMYPSSARAPTALLRAAQLEQGRDNRTRSRSMLNQLVTAYPRSPEATRAKELLAPPRPRR